MSFISYKSEVLEAFKASKSEICDKFGTYVVGAYQSTTPVVTGNMREHETFDKLDNNSGIEIGCTPEAPYSIDVELGNSRQRDQHILLNAATNSVSELEAIASEILSHIGNGNA